jgi:glyoxylase-like metal-dependent hydrolase (beta-lactamase superfamily II)
MFKTNKLVASNMTVTTSQIVSDGGRMTSTSEWSHQEAGRNVPGSSSPEAAVNSGIHVGLELFAAGYCRHPEFLTLAGGTIRPVSFPAGFALITHPERGYILFDTGYSARFFQETSKLPALLYRWITPVIFKEEDSALNQLKRLGIEAEEIRFIILSHFHGDHIAGLRDFPAAAILYKGEAYNAVKGLGAFAAVKAAYLPGLLPGDFAERSLLMEDAARRTLSREFPFEHGYDLFGDGSLIAVDVPGHAAGQIGLFLTTDAGPHFLCADAVWSSRAYRERRKPHAAARLIMSSPEQYEDSFQRLCSLHEQYPHIEIVPSHCAEALSRGKRGNGL